MKVDICYYCGKQFDKCEGKLIMLRMYRKAQKVGGDSIQTHICYKCAKKRLGVEK